MGHRKFFCSINFCFVLFSSLYEKFSEYNARQRRKSSFIYLSLVFLILFSLYLLLNVLVLSLRLCCCRRRRRRFLKHFYFSVCFFVWVYFRFVSRFCEIAGKRCLCSQLKVEIKQNKRRNKIQMWKYNGDFLHRPAQFAFISYKWNIELWLNLSTLAVTAAALWWTAPSQTRSNFVL